MAVPSSVMDRVNRLETARKRVSEAHKSDPAAQAARRAAQADRNARKELLLELAVEIFRWRDEAVKSSAGQRVWSLLGGAKIPLYAGWFWDGLPIEEHNPVQAQTCISLDGANHHFLVEEWRDGAPHREVARATTPIQLLDHLHPDLIVELQTFLSGSDGWQQIVNELDRRLAHYHQG